MKKIIPPLIIFSLFFVVEFLRFILDDPSISEFFGIRFWELGLFIVMIYLIIVYHKKNSSLSFSSFALFMKVLSINISVITFGVFIMKYFSTLTIHDNIELLMLPLLLITFMFLFVAKRKEIKHKEEVLNNKS
jgi:hypothetical protein